MWKLNQTRTSWKPSFSESSILYFTIVGLLYVGLNQWSQLSNLIFILTVFCKEPLVYKTSVSFFSQHCGNCGWVGPRSPRADRDHHNNHTLFQKTKKVWWRSDRLCCSISCWGMKVKFFLLLQESCRWRYESWGLLNPSLALLPYWTYSSYIFIVPKCLTKCFDGDSQSAALLQ